MFPERMSGIRAAALAGDALRREALRVGAEERTVFVELGESAKAAQIAREGVAIPVVRVDRTALDDFLVGKERVVAKVVSQSVQAGALVPTGTAVDVVLAEPRRLPVDILEEFHVGLAERTIGNVYDTFIRNNEDVRRVIARNATPETLSDSERAVIASAFDQAEVGIGTDAATGVQAAFKTLQAAYTFGAAG